MADASAGTGVGNAPASAAGSSGSLFTGASLPLVTSAQTNQTTAPSFYLDYLNNLATQGMNANPQFAGPSPLQSTAFNTAAQTAGAWQPSMNMATNYLGQVNNYDPTQASSGALTSALSEDAMGAANPYLTSAANPTYNTVDNYMSPYINDVVNSIGSLGQQNILNNVAPQTTAGVVGAGQFGSQRGAQALGQTLNNAGQAITGLQANALNTGYQSAMNQAQAGATLQGQLGQIAGGLTNTEQQNLGTIGNIQGNLTSQAQQNLINAGSASGNLASTTGALGWNDITGLLNAGNVQQQLSQSEQMFPLTAATAESQLLRGYQIPTSTASSLTQPGSQNSYANSPLQNVSGLTALLGSGNWSSAADNIKKLFGGSGSSPIDYNTTSNAGSVYGADYGANIDPSMVSNINPSTGMSWADSLANGTGVL